MSSTITTTAPLANASVKQTKTRAKKNAEKKPAVDLVLNDEPINEDLTIEKKIEIVLPENEKDTITTENETMSAKPIIYESDNESEIDEVEELQKKLDEAKAKKREKEIRKDIVKLRENHNEILRKRQTEIDEQIKRLTADRELIGLEITANENGENDDLLVKLALQKTSAVAVARPKPVATATTGEPKEKRVVAKVERPELNEICGKKTTFKCVWAKGVEYEATYDPATKRLTWKGNEYKNLNDWINGKEKVAGNSIADERGQKTSAKSAWKVSYVLNAKNEWVFCDTLVKGCERVI